MKLNLLPKHVAKSHGSKAAFFIMLIIIAASAAGSYLLIKSGQDALAKSKEPVDGLRRTVEQAMGNSNMAETVIAEMTNIDRNIKLTNAMLAHNGVYVDLYREVLSYVPSYYRITSITAAPSGAEGCTITMNGVLKSHSQYADLALALYRMPGVSGVTRGGYALIDPRVPSLNESDQIGTAIKPGEANLPSDPEERMAALIQRASVPSGFLGINNFGTESTFKGAMPDWSNVTVSIAIAGRNIQTPNPRGTLFTAAPGNTPPGGGPASR